MKNLNWTKEQSQAIHETGSNILVAAGAGSGKTAVLVERMIHKIIDEKMDIDKILVVTFTNAAASEMRGRVLEAIYKKIEENQKDEHLQRQIMLLPKSNICTIHSFCLDVIKNHFYELDLPASFKIGEQAELELLKQDVLEELFEKKYEEKNEKFVHLLDAYTNYRGDEPLKELILSLYRYIQSSPFPDKWLEDKVQLFQLQDHLGEDFSTTIWGEFLLKIFHTELENCITALKSIQQQLRKDQTLEKFYQVICSDMDQLEKLQRLDSWDLTCKQIHTVKFERWPTDKKVVSDLREIAKEKRDDIKKTIRKIKENFFEYDSKQSMRDLQEMYPVLDSLRELIIEFSEEYTKAKKEKNMIDFNDIEHLALNILVKEENGGKVPTEVAKKYQEKFEEIAIDEYQDSNLVQEYILTTISRGNNMFMVGDVKQSIYKFRQARPELFMEKYQMYRLKENKTKEENLKIQLFKNFRSRSHILQFINQVFQDIMSDELGDIEYKEEEYLNAGADYPESEVRKEEYITELNLIDLQDENGDELEEIETEKEERIENVQLEAKFVANKIKAIIDSNQMIYDKKMGYRPITYKDIVILLRATTTQASVYEKELIELAIPVFSDTSETYLDSIEIQTIMSLLKVIDNPMQDIPLVTVLRSPIVGITDNELVSIRVNRKQVSFYESMKQYLVSLQEKKMLLSEEKLLQKKIEEFFYQLQTWRDKQEYTPLDELIWQIYMDTGYYQYVSLMPNGGFRQANLKMLFERAKQYENASFKGLFNFIHFIEKLQVSSGDLGAAKLIGENENVVRIMSIHKSKGLEFPVVFLSSMGKSFNMRDLNTPILFHQELGLGPKYIDVERKIECPTLAKEAIKEKNRLEMLSEEMRVLYVAFTRAKEKLIMTGITKDISKQLKEKEELLEMYVYKEKINQSVVKKYKTYLDWIELVYLNHREELKELLEVNVFSKKELMKNFKMEIKKEQRDWLTQIETKEIKKQEIDKIKEILTWNYPYLPATKIPSKTSVSKIKEMASEENYINQIQDSKISMKRPDFLEETKITNTQKGSLVHLCLQKLDEKEDYTKEKIELLIKNLYYKKIITEKEANSIDVQTIVEFTQSDLWRELKEAKQVLKEVPFYINIPAKELYQEEVEEQILVQGVIDLYYRNKKGELILVDYKTDYIPNQDETILVEKYSKQLEIYKRALEECYQQKVDKVYLYSTYLKKRISIYVE